MIERVLCHDDKKETDKISHFINPTPTPIDEDYIVVNYRIPRDNSIDNTSSPWWWWPF